MEKQKFIFTTQKDQVEYEKKIKSEGYLKISDCMWVKVYRKGYEEVVLCREY